MDKYSDDFQAHRLYLQWIDSAWYWVSLKDLEQLFQQPQLDEGFDVLHYSHQAVHKPQRIVQQVLVYLAFNNFLHDKAQPILFHHWVFELFCICAHVV